jgi:chromosome segregation ATPase
LIELPDSQMGSMADCTASSTAELDSATVEVLNLREMLAMAQSQIATQKEELLSKNKQIEQLHILLQQAQAALPAPKDTRPWWQFWRR